MNFEAAEKICEGEPWKPTAHMGALPLELPTWRGIEEAKIDVDRLGPPQEGPWLYVFEHEDVCDSVIQFGRLVEELLPVRWVGKCDFPVDGSTFELVAAASLSGAGVEIPGLVETADPPLGRKVCRKCQAVSFDLVKTCPSCSAERWWL
jgi:hypothetical protein